MREAQMLATRFPHTALVVTIDLGQANNVHPPYKADVGARVALAAAATVYGQHVEYSGPIYDASRIEGSTIHISFRNACGGLQTTNQQPLRGFAIAGSDHRFFYANARIEGQEVVTYSPNVPAPKEVRYDWADNPDGNLTNCSRIPASPFRTDDLPGMTVKKE